MKTYRIVTILKEFIKHWNDKDNIFGKTEKKAI